MLKKNNKTTPKMSFITPCYNDGDEIERYVDSLIDQDFKNWELIIVNDGSTDDSKNVINALVQKDERVRAIHLKKNQGACIARNKGAKEAKGEIYSFLPADSFLYPGMLRIWVEQLDEYKDYDFLYGGYRLVDNKTHEPLQGGELLFHPFDPYLLQVMNYIDGSFPIRAKAFWEVTDLMVNKLKRQKSEGLWDPAIKSLQDWDFWLSVVQIAKKKGIYIQDIFFETTAPHPGGLSYDSAENWIERTEAIKKKHGIPDRKLCVASLGATFHAKRLAYILNADFKEMPSFKAHKYESIYVIGFYPEFAPQQDMMFWNNAYNKDGGKTTAKKIIHFVGTDIWQLRKISLDGLQIWKQYIRNFIDEVLVEADFTRDELKEILGIEAKIVPIPPAKLYKTMPLPKKFTVACYQPATNAAFYNPQIMEEVAKQMPNVEFKFFGNPMTVGKHKDIKNIENVGYINDMETFIKECSAIMRFPMHDGLPISVLEFVLAGRYATLNVPVKETYFVPKSDVKSIIHSLDIIQKRIKKEGINKKASKHWRKELDHGKYKTTMEKIALYDPKSYWENRAESWDAQANSMEVEENDVKKFYNIVKPKSVLDIGAGNGRWIPILEKWGLDLKNYLGTDISGKLVDIAQKKYPKASFLMQGIEQLKMDKKYDLIFSYTTLEHVREEDIVNVAKRIKKCGKKLLLIEPTDFISRHYCRSHDYEKIFKVIKKKKLKDKTIFLCDLSA